MRSTYSRSRSRPTMSPVFGLVGGFLVVGVGLFAVTSTSAATSKATVTVAGKFIGKSGPAQVDAAVKASALPVAVGLRASLGKPSCPPVEKPKVGLTLQCLITFDKQPVGWLVTLRADGTLFARPTFPVVSKRAAEEIAGKGSVCALVSISGRPIGSTIDCTVRNTTVELLVGPNGTLTRR